MKKIRQLLSSLDSWILEPYSDQAELQRCKIIHFLYFILSGWLLIPVVIMLIVISQAELSKTVLYGCLIIALAGLFSLVLTRKGLFKQGAAFLMLFTTIVLHSGLLLRFRLDPLSVFGTSYYLMFAVIIAGALFCPPWVTYLQTGVTVLSSLTFFHVIAFRFPLAEISSVRAGATYLVTALILLLILSRVAIKIHQSALEHMRDEFDRDISQFMEIQQLSNSSRQLREAYEDAKEMALKDALTGLKNRRFLDEVLVEEVEHFIFQKMKTLNPEDEHRSRSLHSYGLIMVDIDHFKAVNDTHGHEAGDQLLTLISNRLSGLIRQDDIALRWGGEEFLLLLRNTREDYLPNFAQKLLDLIGETPFRLKLPEGEILISQTVSAGFTAIPLNEEDPFLIPLEKSIILVDKALYRAKRGGRKMAIGVSPGKKLLAEADINAVLNSLEYGIEQNLIKISVIKQGKSDQTTLQSPVILPVISSESDL